MDGSFLMENNGAEANCQDARYRKTERKLRNTYAKIGGVKNVRGFCKEAEVSSASFYRHVHSVREIFERQFKEILGEFLRGERSFYRLLILAVREKVFFRTVIQFGEWWVFGEMISEVCRRDFERFSSEIAEWMMAKFIAQATVIIWWWGEKEDFRIEKLAHYVKKLEQIKKKVEQEGMK